MAARARTLTHIGQFKCTLTANYASDRDPDGIQATGLIHALNSLYRTVIGSHQEIQSCLLLQQSSWTDVLPVQPFLSQKIPIPFSLPIIPHVSVSTDCHKQTVYKQSGVFLDACNQGVKR